MSTDCGVDRGSTPQVQGAAGAKPGSGGKHRISKNQLVSQEDWVCPGLE